MNATHDRAKSIFLNAAEITSPEERRAFVEAECAGDVTLHNEVDELLHHEQALGGFLEAPAVAAEIDRFAVLDEPLAEGPGTVIGPYKLLQQIGEGGMGVVFMAEQTEPVRRTVALKIIKPGMDTRQVIARFEAERQALAMMDHPNIARVLDAGTTDAPARVGEGETGRGGEPDDQASIRISPSPPLPFSPSISGRPYFVMDLVKGVPITDYCDQNRLTVRERLALFTQVCHAVQHAHQKGIIHRDLKPSNVLVQGTGSFFADAPQSPDAIEKAPPIETPAKKVPVPLSDEMPLVKVIDFGVAKATAQRLTERTVFTQYGQLIGTFEYMSPEQARINQLDVDTRSDIYSLGVLLYELLAGSTPLEKERLRSAAFDEILRLISEEEPPKPSTRLSSIRTISDSLPLAGRVGEGGTSSLASIAANRHTEPAKLTKELSGELDWIVVKCLEKDRNRRYETASSLARDIERYLGDEPVQACPPSTGYRFRKFARRNKAKLLAGSAIAATLAIGLGLAAWQYVRASTENARARAVSSLLQAILAPSDLERTKGSQHNLRELSDEFSAGLGDQVADYHVQLAEILTNQSRTARGPEDARQLSIAAAARLAEAHRHIRQAIDAYDRMAIEYANDFDRRVESTTGFIQVLKVCLATPGFADEVDELNARLTAELPKLLAAFPDSNHCQLQTAYRYVDWAYALNRYPAYRSVEEHAYRKEIEILDRLSLSNPKQSSIWLFLADAHDHLGGHYWESARPQEAAAAFLRSKEIYDEHSAEIAAEEQSQPYGIACHYGRLAYFLDHTDREDEAAECVRKTVDTAKHLKNPVHSITVLWGMTPLQLRMGDHAGYRETCQALVEVPVADADEFTKVRQILAWVLGPNALDDLSLPVKRAEELAAYNSLGLRDLILLDLGAALYRNRQYERAADELEASIAAYPSEPEPGYDSVSLQRLFLAMTKWQLGHQDEARQLLARTLTDIDKDLQSTSLGWNQRVALEVLRREAQSLIEPKEPDKAVEIKNRSNDGPKQ